VRVLGVGLLVVFGLAPAALAAPQAYKSFRTQGGLITCAYTAPPGRYSESALRCDIRTGLKPRVKRPKGCEFDFGGTLVLLLKGRTRIGCVSDAISPVQRVLRYGQTWRAGPFTCKLTRAGLTCTNKGKRGFFLSKKAWRRI
jgi:hypothetical protein